MRCTLCGFTNQDTASFCGFCGAHLLQKCQQCGEAAAPNANFCSHCGARLTVAPDQLSDFGPAHYTPPHLAARILAERTAMETRCQPAGERKTITALFADMAGSTALIQDLDPEDARHLIDPVINLMMESVHHYEGFVAKVMGDGILALFGAPIAHEDHAARALYAALRMQDAIRRHGNKLRLEQGIPLQIRVGIHTGEVVVRSIRKDDLHTDYDPVGHTIHITSRVEGVATPASILVSEDTHRLTNGYFEFKALGSTHVKGVRDPLMVYEVVGLGTLRTRLQVAAHRGLAKFVGRTEEMAQLQRALDCARDGHGQIVAVVGEAGVGKSRLFHEFKGRSQQDCLVLETFSVSHGKAFAYLPLIELLKNYFQVSAQDSDRTCRERVTGRLLALDRSLEAHLPYLLYLLGVVEPGSTVATMDPAVRRRRTFEAIAHVLVRESVNQPLEIVFEDLQWLDSETESCLDIFAEHVQRARIVLLVNYRPEYSHAWSANSHYTQLNLESLGPADAGGLLTALLGEDDSLASLKPLILAKTEGNPFFMEEVVQTLVEERALLGLPGCYHIEQIQASLHIPTTVQGVLASRIDRLAPTQKELLQTLAVVGKEFPLSLIRQVTVLSDDQLRPLLAELQAADFIYERPAFPDIEYAFKHALTQEVAGSSLLTERRRAVHERTAQAIEALFGNRLQDYFSELAHHYRHSGNVQKAIEYLHRAGKQTLERSGHHEAIQHLTMALELVKLLPDPAERAPKELAILLTIGPARIAAFGHASQEVEATYSRALALCRQGNATPQSFSAELGLWGFYQLRAQYTSAQALAERLLSVALRTRHPDQLAEAHRALGATLYRLGDIEGAWPHLEQVVAMLPAAQQPLNIELSYARVPAVRGLSTLSTILWRLGFPDQAFSRSQQALALARKVVDPFSLVVSLVFAAELHQCRREVQPARTYAEAAITVSSQQGFPLYLAWGTTLLGWAMAEQGESDQGIAQMRLGLAGYAATGTELGRSGLLAMLAESLGKAGQAEAGLQVLGEASSFVNRTEERYDESSLHRINGELLLQLSKGTEAAACHFETAEDCLRRAIAVARTQGARSLELRAALSLARLLKSVGRLAETRDALTAIHQSFTEGFDGTDWQQAKGLLDSIG